MRKSNYTEEQILGFLRQVEAGMPVKHLCRKHGFSDASFYKWRVKFGRMNVTEAKRLEELESGNGKLKKLLAEAHLDIHALKKRFRYKALAPSVKREAMATMVMEHHLSERHACTLVELFRDAFQNPAATHNLNGTLSTRIIKIAHPRRRVGYLMIHHLVRPEHPASNRKRIYRLYSEAGLAVRRKVKV